VDVPRLNVGSNIQTKDRNVNGEKGNLIRRGRLTKQAIRATGKAKTLTDVTTDHQDAIRLFSVLVP
jgi:hypothetical protein